jgi:hypothetical protein
VRARASISNCFDLNFAALLLFAFERKVGVGVGLDHCRESLQPCRSCQFLQNYSGLVDFGGVAFSNVQVIAAACAKAGSRNAKQHGVASVFDDGELYAVVLDRVTSCIAGRVPD